MGSIPKRNVRSGKCLALVGATIHGSPVTDAIRDGVVVIHDQSIVAVGPRGTVAVPQNTEIVDCSGLAVTAGFWNSHVHFFERKWAEAATMPAAELGAQLEEMLTSRGFTTVFDLGSMWTNTKALRERVENGEVPGPRILSTGEGLLPPGAMPSEQILALMGIMNFPAPEISDAVAGAAAVRKLLDAGVDAIKLFASSPRGPSLSESAFQAAAHEAHEAAKLVFVHPNSAADVLNAVRAGADVIAHTTPQSGPWDNTIIEAMKQRRVALIPTLQLWKYQRRHERRSAQAQLVATAVGQLRAWIVAGGPVLFGTDLGAVEYDPTDEYVLMADAGMTFAQILASLTTAPAQQFGESMRLGRIAPGFQADLVALREDPLKNIRALSTVDLTIRAGEILYRAAD